MNFPLVSVGIPTYMRPSMLRNALDSITKQTYNNLEILVSENFSTEEIREEVLAVVNEFSSRDSRIFFFPQKNNIGAQNFQYLLDQAKGQFFMWAADDDLWRADFIQVCVRALLENTSYVAAFSCFSSIDEHGASFRHFSNLPLGKTSFKGIYNFCVEHESKGKANPVYAVFKKNALSKIFERNPFSPWKPFVDVNVVAEAMMCGGIYVVPEFCFFKTLERNGETGFYVEPPDSELPRVITKCENFVYIRRLISSGYRNGALLPVCLALFVRSVKEVYNWLYNKGHKIFLCV